MLVGGVVFTGKDSEDMIKSIKNRSIERERKRKEERERKEDILSRVIGCSVDVWCLREKHGEGMHVLGSASHHLHSLHPSRIQGEAGAEPTAPVPRFMAPV